MIGLLSNHNRGSPVSESRGQGQSRFFDDICHKLQGKLKPECVTEVPHSLGSDWAADFLCAAGCCDDCVFVGDSSLLEIGRHPIAEAVGAADSYGDAVCSVVTGELVYFKPEGRDRLVLTTDLAIRDRLRGEIAKHDQMKEGDASARKRRGSRS